jgi:hypothetical protein
MIVEGERRDDDDDDDSFLLSWDVIVKCDDILFHAYFAEIESNGSQILIRGEYGDEKVDEEIISRG